MTTVADAIDGDTSSASALIAAPGPDGISLREAMLAVNAAPGTRTVTFSPALAGQTIALQAILPAFEREGVSFVGLVDDAGQPSITLDGSLIDPAGPAGLLTVAASDVALAHLRLTHVSVNMVNIHADEPGRPKTIRNVTISDSVFDNAGFTGTGLSIGMEPASGSYAGATDAVVGQVTISRNHFLNFSGHPADAINVQVTGLRGTVEDLLIADNIFSDNSETGEPCIELGNSVRGNQIMRTTITGNLFERDWAPIFLGQGAWPGLGTGSGNVISDTLISGNVFRDSVWPVLLSAGVGDASANSIVNTTFSNNLMTGAQNAIGLRAGDGDGASGNEISGVVIDRLTIAYNNGGISVEADANGASGNAVDGVVVTSSIFWNNEGLDFFGSGLARATVAVSNSVTVAAMFVGESGNIGRNPRFVDPANGDFRLEPDSPATGLGFNAP